MHIPLEIEGGAELSKRETEERLLRLFAAPGPPTPAERRNEERVSAVVSEFLRAAGVSSEATPRALAEQFADTRLPGGTADVDGYLEYLADNVVAHSTRTSSPRFIGHMTSALPSFVRPLGKLMAALNQNTVKVETSKALTPFERQTLGIMHRLVYERPEEFYERHVHDRASTLGIMVSGGTLGNVTALWCARNAALGPDGDFAGIESEGLAAALAHYGHRGAVVVGSSLMHYSLRKAADLLGLGEAGLVEVPTDGAGRISLGALRETVARCREEGRRVIAVVGVAGTTESGAVDDLEGVARVAREAGAHFHVDAAWGGALLFSRRHRRKLAGIAEADTVVIDGHKQLYLPMGVSLVLLRDPHAAAAIEKQARYIVRAGSNDLGRRAVEGSRPASAMFLHAALHILGRDGYEVLVDEAIRKTQHMAGLLRERAEFELLSEPEMNILLYRYLPRRFRGAAARGGLDADDNRAVSEFNVRLQREQRRAGHSFVSRTSFEAPRHGGLPVVALRAVIANPLTTEEDIAAVLEEQVAIAAALEAEAAGGGSGS